MLSESAEGSEVRARLGVITNDFPPKLGGIQSYFLSLFESLGPEEVIVVAPRVEGCERFDRRCPFEVVRIATPPEALLPTPKTAKLVAGLLKSRGVDIVGLTSMVPLIPLGVRTATLCDSPLVVWHHGAEIASLARIPFSRIALGKYGRKVDVHFVVSNWTGSVARQAFGEGADIRLMRFGVDADRFHPVSSDDEKMRKRSEIGVANGDADPLLLSVGRLVKRKGNDVLVSVVTLMKSRYPKCSLVIAGRGPDRQRLEKLVAQSPVSEKIQFLGAVDGDMLPDLYRCADIFVAPIRSRFFGIEGEGLGITLVEAAASGLPVVAGRSGGTPEAVVDGISGFVVDGADPYEVVAAIARIVVDKDLRRAMGTKGREFVQSEFSRSKMAHVFRAAARDVLDRTG